MSEKRAVVVDTNFIIENKNLKEVCDKLSEHNCVLYITQVAINERIAQECIQQKRNFEKVENIQKEMADIAEVKFKKNYDDVQNMYKKGMQKNYEDLLQGRIIPLNANDDTFNCILERAYMKIPPFIKTGTDKGLKDSLMWISVLDYFKSMGESEIVFLSNDNGFLENKEELCVEFEQATNKKIEIKGNSYYKDLICEVAVIEKEERSVLDVEKYRDRIQDVIEEICVETVEGLWGPEHEVTFTTTIPFDSYYVEKIFSELKAKIRSHIFEQRVSAKVMLDYDDRINDADIEIRITALESASELHDEITAKHPEYLPQFYSAVANVLNSNYRKPVVFPIISDDEIPF